MSSMQKIQNASISRLSARAAVVPAWQLVLRRELTDLWIGGRALHLLFLYSLLLGIMSYTYAFSAQTNLVPPQEAVYEMLKNATAFSVFIGLIIGADSFSGERDRSTLESLLLTPVNRRHVVLAKLLAGISIWPAAYLIALPFLYVLAQGNQVLGPAMLWGAVTGTVLVAGYTGLGMLVSFWSSSNKISYFISLSIYALHLVPVELTGDGVDIAGEFLQWINPLAASNYFLSKHLLYYRNVGDYWPWLLSSILLTLATFGLLLRLAGSRLRLEPGLRRKTSAALRRFLGLSVLFTVLALPLNLRLQAASALTVQQAHLEGIEIAIDSKYKLVKMGDIVQFTTTISNNGVNDSPPLIAALNAISLHADGESPDLEEWAPRRTEFVGILKPDQSIELDWMITTGVHGDYLVYVVLIPEPANAEETTHPVASSSLQLTVVPSAGLNAQNVLPFALGVPVLLLAITFVVYRRRSQQIDVGDPL